MNGLVWGLTGALLIGGSDCIARVTAQRLPRALLILCLMGLSTLGLTLWLAWQQNFPPWHTAGWLSSALSGGLNLVALLFLYTALSRGPVAVASTAASSFSVMLIAMNVIAGAAFNTGQLLAGLIVFLGIAMLARRSDEAGIDAYNDARALRVTALYGLATAFTISLRMFLAQDAGEYLGSVHALYLNRVFATLAALMLVAWQWRRRSIGSILSTVPGKGLVLLVVLQTVLETASLFVFLLGSSDGGRVAATIGFSAFAAVTTLFARLFLGERVGWRRSGWIAVVIAGLLLAAVSGQ